MRQFRKFIFVVVLMLPVAVVVWALTLPSAIDDAYAQWVAVDMVIDYMKLNAGKWPSDWESLRPEFEKNHGRVGGTFEQFQRRIVIDFSANSDALCRQAIESDRVTFDVIHARSPLAAVMGDGPNANLHRYFRINSGIIEAPEPRGGWRSRKHKQLADDWYRRGFQIRFDDQGEIVSAWTTLSERSPPGDNDITELKNHVRLKELNLVGSNVTDAGLEVIKQLPNLEELVLGGDKLTDAGLEHLSGHPALRSIDLFGTQISNTGLQRLREIPMLRSIRLDPLRISPQAVEELKSAVLNLMIREQGEIQVRGFARLIPFSPD